MPVLFNGFIPAAITIMVLCLAAKQVYHYWKHFHQKL